MSKLGEMYSGKDGIEYPTGWALNPMAYQHMPNEQVDWAALAQQWIQMKETCPPAAMSVTPQPPPPPPPVISAPSDGEGGEAPMDVEGDVEAPAPPVITPQQWNCPNGWDRTWNSQWGNWGWSQNSGSKSKTPLMPTPEAPYQGYSTGDSNTPGYTTTNNNANQQSFSAGYWSGDDSNSETKSRLPARGNRFSPSRQAMPQRRGAPHIQRQNQYQMSAEAQDTTQTIDAAKRKQLPAWIREGLEKMEREKQKEMDKQREKKERDEYLFMKKLEEENSAKQSQPDDGLPKMPAKSKFDSESEKSDDEEKEIEKTASKIDRTIKTQVHRIPPPTLLKRSAEEIMKDLMLNVRRTLTEILLEVTDDQIHAIAKEEMSRFKSHQASRGATVASKLQGLSTIGGGLGLGIYGDSSDSESESGVDSRSGTPDRRQREKSGDVTDGQLQETIRRRKAEFEKTTREIESRIAEEERAEQQRAKKEITRTPPRRSPSSSSSSSADGNQRHAESDGESTTTNNRNEQSGHSYKKSSWDNTESKKHSTEKSHREDKKNTEDKTNKHSTKYQTSQDSHKSPKKSKIKTSKTSDSSSDSSDSESNDSFLDNNNSESGSDSSSSTSNSSQKSSSKSGSDSSYKRSKKKKRRSSDDSVKEKKRKSKSKKRNKHSDKGSDKYEEDDTPSSSRKKYSREESASTKDIRTKSSRNSLYSPERKSHKSKNSHRSRSRSDERKSKRYESSSSRYRDRSRERSSYSRDRRSRSRDKKSRSDRRDYRSRSRDRDRSRDRSSRDKRGRSREGRRDRRGDSRSYYY